MRSNLSLPIFVDTLLGNPLDNHYQVKYQHEFYKIPVFFDSHFGGNGYRVNENGIPLTMHCQLGHDIIIEVGVHLPFTTVDFLILGINQRDSDLFKYIMNYINQNYKSPTNDNLYFVAFSLFHELGHFIDFVKNHDSNIDSYKSFYEESYQIRNNIEDYISEEEPFHYVYYEKLAMEKKANIIAIDLLKHYSNKIDNILNPQ